MQNGGLGKYMAKYFPDHEKINKHTYILTVPVHLHVEGRHETHGAKRSYGQSDDINDIAKEKRVSAPRHPPKKSIDND
jgi:hypothetical protein